MVQQQQQRKKSNLALRPGAKSPNFKLSDLKAAIPAHCFERSALKSGAYLAADLAFVLGLLWILHNVWNPSMLPSPISWVAWCVYAFIQGSVMTGMWVIAHECGHQAFSPSQIINDTVGFIFHTALLVPYFSWKISHAKHHQRTGSMEGDEVFVPGKMDEMTPSDHPIKHTAPLRFLQIVFMLVFGWPAYLVTNVTSHATEDRVNHFNPYCSLFTAREQGLVLLSDAGLIVWTFILYKFVMASSLSWVLWTYGLPMIVVNAWLVCITALQHTHKDIPHYDNTTWNWLRGALTTVDRNYSIFSPILHHIGDTHIAHHLFSTMPHYHAVEATEALKSVLGEYYLYDNTPLYKALWVNTRECFAVENENGLYWWHRSPFAAKPRSH